MASSDEEVEEMEEMEADISAVDQSTLPPRDMRGDNPTFDYHVVISFRSRALLLRQHFCDTAISLPCPSN